ncbi:DEAD/DEAH box helicase family protein [Peribacillus frigoritolerans]|uniref:DEAD/DEAH box helicase family protein n=1 Tax=Peribacillus frigoritolerans TaxID=450367 RepID=UPI003F858D89
MEKILQPGISLIASPTGTGKSTFIIEELVKPMFENENHAFGDGEYNQFTGNSAALLNNRTAVTIKTIGDVHNLSKKIGVSSTSNIDVSSYQKISSKEAIDSIDKGKIIICDEAHYFIADAWNLTTPLIVEKLIEVSKTKPVIMFTATPQLIYKYLVEYRKLELNAFLDFRDELGFSDRMDFICTNKSLKEIIKDIPKDEKWLVFVEDMRSRKLIQKFCTELNDEGYEVEFYHSMWIQTKNGKFIGIKVDSNEEW